VITLEPPQSTACPAARGRGTDGSNLLSSSKESANFRSLSGGRIGVRNVDGGASGQQDFIGGRLGGGRVAVSAQLGSVLDRDFALVARAVGGDLGGCDFVGCRGQIRHTRGSGPSRRAGVTAARIGEADERAAPLHVERWCHGVDVSGGGRSFR
jgi:hypothetical protein